LEIWKHDLCEKGGVARDLCFSRDSRGVVEMLVEVFDESETELFRRLQHDAVARVNSRDGSIGAQLLKGRIDSVAQALVRAHHADRDIPVEVCLTLVAVQDAELVVGMRQVEIAGDGRRDRGGVDLVATVDDRAVRLNGLNVPFRFKSGRLDPYGWYCIGAGLASLALLHFSL